ncbi:uncharacterized protein BX663DRAFT_536768 [Cokeromyces recurvatus]|uniref:uncharacterized protein n=1 Tax=Cokeromyces recurvatus TaxID=90255 RepID=UPI002220A229|nr:uncharacterized protein BX663DRAFT_536768 [Cokeromyces recurvatus]KAI7902124.1 hypothetical protein BX663DRAFT_536768 [Cokeromyces recurvatus]
MSKTNQSKGIKPSEFKSKPIEKPLIDQISSQKSKDDIPDDEKLRLIDQTGLLKKVKKREAELAEPTTAEYIWQAIFLSIPFGFLMATFDVTVKVQYSEPWNYASMIVKCVKSAPALAPFIYLTNRYKSNRLAQILMSIGSAVCGSLLMYTLRHSPSLGQMMRAPGLATIWIYFIIQLDLAPATLTLLLVLLYWYFGLRV